MCGIRQNIPPVACSILPGLKVRPVGLLGSGLEPKEGFEGCRAQQDQAQAERIFEPPPGPKEDSLTPARFRARMVLVLFGAARVAQRLRSEPAFRVQSC